MRSTAGSTRRRWLRTLLLCFAGCSAQSAHLLPLRHLAADARAPSPAALEIVTASTTVREPLQLHGTGLAFVDLAPALREAVAAQVDGSFQKWRLSLELVAADAEYAEGRLIVRMTARATLRARADGAYLAQSQHVCSSSGVVAPEAGAQVAHGCLLQIARDVGSWLERERVNRNEVSR